MEDLVYTPVWKSFIRKLVLCSSLKTVFKSNGYPKNFFDSWIKHFLDKLFVKNKESLTVPKLQLVYVLLYTGKFHLDLRAHVWDARFRKLYHSVNSMLLLDTLADLVTCLDSKILSWKKLSLE